jgi:prefoldin subunit 5
MTFEESMDRLKERHEALTQSVELLAIETRELKNAIGELNTAIAQDAENIRALARIAEIHERRITHLENGQQ